MDSEQSLRDLLELFGTPAFVAAHLNVSVPTVYDNIHKFGITLARPRIDHVELRRKIQEVRADIPDVTIRRMAAILGVSKTTILTVLRQQPAEVPPPAERPMGSRESRLRTLLESLLFPRLVAAEMGVEVSTIYEMMQQYGVKLPKYNATQKRKAVGEMREDLAGYSMDDLASISGIPLSTLQRAARTYRPSPPPLPSMTTPPPPCDYANKP